MKPTIAKPDDAGMKFFTPDLYLRFNSDDDREADAADEAWESALRDYRSHLDALTERLPSYVQALADLCLHDAEFIGIDQAGESANGPASATFPIAIVTMKLEGEVLSLIYALGDRVRVKQPSADWPFSKSRVHWLYDEIDRSAQAGEMFVQRILFSDGRIIEIPFLSAFIHRLPLASLGITTPSKQSA